MAATTNLARVYSGDSRILWLPCTASTIIYVGAAVSLASGYLRPLNVADAFAGFAEEFVDMTGLSNGARFCKVRAEGEIELAIAGTLAVTDIGGAVYATDDNTFKKTSTSALQIGKLSRFISATEGRVFFQAAILRSI